MIIAIDYDGTIADTNQEKVKWIKHNVGIDIAPWHCNRTDCVPLIGLEAYEKMGNFVYERESTLQADEMTGALTALHRLSQLAEVWIVTARPVRRMEFAKEWLKQNGLLRYITDLSSSDGTTKEKVCRTINAQVLVDDDFRHLRNVDTDQLACILLQHGSQKQMDFSPDLTFCSDWSEVVDIIISILNSGSITPT